MSVQYGFHYTIKEVELIESLLQQREAEAQKYGNQTLAEEARQLRRKMTRQQRRLSI